MCLEGGLIVLEDFGQHLRELRLSKGLTKEAFCQDEQELSVRQLTRLETGKSQPKLQTLEYLAHRLDMTVSELLGEESVVQELPEEYLKLKYQLIHTPTYDDPKVLGELDEKISFVLDNYYDDLPMDEQIVIDILQSKIYSYISSAHQKYGMKTLEKNLQRLCEERIYTVNDLLLLQLYQVSLGDSQEVRSNQFDRNTFRSISRNLLRSKEGIPFEYLFLLRDALITIPAVEHERKEYCYTKDVLEQLNQIMEETQDFQKKAILRVMEAQYAYYVEKDKEKAGQAYQDAILLARLLGNDYLAEKIAVEQENDFKN